MSSGNVISISIWLHSFLYLKKAKKMVILPEKRMELDPQTHIYLESVSQGEHHKHIYMATPLRVFKKKEKIIELQA